MTAHFRPGIAGPRDTDALIRDGSGFLFSNGTEGENRP